MKKVLPIIILFFSGFAFSQSGFHIGLSAGPDKSIIEKEKNAIYPPNSGFKGRTSIAEVIYFEYGFNDIISIKANLRNVSYGYKAYFNNLRGITSTGYEYLEGRTETLGFNYLQYELALGLRSPIIKNKLFLISQIGFFYLPTANIYVEKFEGGVGFKGMDYLNYHSSVFALNRKHDYGINIGLGLEFKVLKKNYISIGIYNQQGFKTIGYLVGQTNLNGQLYTNTVSSNASFYTIQLGLKRTIRFKKKVIEEQRVEIEDKEEIETSSDNVKNDSLLTLTSSDTDYFFSQGNKIFGASVRLADKDGLYLPIIGVGFMPRLLFLIKNNYAIGPTFYGKYFKYGSIYHHELMAGLATRYYLGKSKNRIFGALDIVVGSYRDMYSEFIPALVPGVGYNRAIGKAISLETSVKYMHLMNSQNRNNLFLDIGINYHF